MATVHKPNLGIMFRREHPPEHLPQFARRAEAAGFDELWIVEDCFYASGIALAAAALACTDAIKVGLGIMPAVARNPVFTAMEIASIARLFPGRFLPGIGHGVAGWMRQIGAFPQSQMRALEEVTVTVRRLLAGEEVTFGGSEVHLDDAALVHPPEQIPPISLGVRGPKSLALSGQTADGTILAEFAPPAYVAWALEQIRGGQGDDRPHRLTVFNFTCIDAETAKVRRQLRPLIAAAIATGKIDAHIRPLGILPAAKEMLADGGIERLEEAMPDEWIDLLSISGTPGQCVRTLGRLVDAGADTVVLVPLPDKALDELEIFSYHLLPSLR